jgi:PAS domain S-box-containing protein
MQSHRVTIALALLLLLIQCAFVAVEILDEREHRWKEAEATAKTIATVSASNTADFFNRYLSIFDTLKSLDFLVQQEAEPSNRILVKLNNKYVDVVNFAAVKKNGDFFASGKPIPEGKIPNVTKLEFFKRILDGAKHVIMQPHSGPISKQMVTGIVVPLEDDQGEINGLLGVSIIYQALIDRWETLISGKQIYLVVHDKNGGIHYMSPGVNIENVFFFKDKSISKIQEIALNGRTFSLYTLPHQESGWQFSVLVPSYNDLSQLIFSRNELIFLFGLMVITIFTLGVWLYHEKQWVSKLSVEQRNLQKSEEKFRGLFTSITDGLTIVDANRIVVDCNPAFSDLFGYSLQEIRGKNARILYQSEEQFVDFGNTLKGYSGDEPLISKVSYKKKNGDLFTGEIAITRMTDVDGKFISYIGLMRDITERVLIEDRLVESQLQFEIAMEASQDGLYDWNLLTNDIYYSPGWKRMLGYEDHGLANDLSVWEKLTNVADLEKSKKMQQELINKDRDRFELEFQMKHKNGHWVDILSRAKATFDNSGKAVRIIGTHVDVTDLKKLKANLLQAHKMESIGNLAGGIAHDFNNILSSIIGFTELALEEAPKGSSQRGDLEEVHIAGNRAKELVQQILAFARQSEEKTKSVRLSDIVTETLKLLRPSTPTNIEIKQTIESTAKVMANTSQLHQIIMNLCTNAIHSLQNSGGVIDINLKKHTLTKGSGLYNLDLLTTKYIELNISDNGPGIDPSIIDNIFEPYFTTKEVGEGSGMGLAMVKGIVESYGGDIQVKSAPGERTSFVIILPVVTARSSETIRQVDQVASGTERILFVDDEPPIARMGSRMLESLGYKVTTRTSSFDALELFKEKSDTFDLVVTDMTMPYMTGDVLLMEMRKIRHDIPIILCTGYSNKINGEGAKQLGIDAFAYKPFTKLVLAKTIREVLDRDRT